MRHLKTAFAIMVTSVLTACATIPGNPSALPGETYLSPSQAVGFFRDVCVTNRPDYNGAIPTMARLGGFTQNINTDHYYHDQYNLSFLINTEVDGTSCIMQFASNRGPGYYQPSFEAVTSRVAVLSARPGLIWVEDR